MSAGSARSDISQLTAALRQNSQHMFRPRRLAANMWIGGFWEHILRLKCIILLLYGAILSVRCSISLTTAWYNFLTAQQKNPDYMRDFHLMQPSHLTTCWK